MTDRHTRFLGNRVLSPETLMVGYGYDPFLSERSLKPPVFHTSTFVFRSAQDGKELFELAYGLRQKRPNMNVSEAEVQTRTAQEKELDGGIPITEGIVTGWPGRPQCDAGSPAKGGRVEP